MNVIVTGGTGFLGSRLIEKLEKRENVNVYSVSKREGTDIRDYNSFKMFLGQYSADVLIHCAALSGGIAINYERPVEMVETNTIIGLNVVKACNELGIKNLITILPNCVYPGGLEEYEESKFWDGPMHESVVTVGIPRKTMWGLCFAYCRQDPSFKPVHLIYPNMYGPTDHFEPAVSHALGALVSKIVEAKHNDSKVIEIWGTGKPIREWLYLDDGAEAILRVIIKLDIFAPNEIMNIGVGKGISIKDMAGIIKDIVGWAGEFIYKTEMPDGSKKKILICNKMKEKLNWQPSTNFEDGIKSTVLWYEKNRKNINIIY